VYGSILFPRGVHLNSVNTTVLRVNPVGPAAPPPPKDLPTKLLLQYMPADRHVGEITNEQGAMVNSSTLRDI
jgi:hypothetical protein